MNIKDIYQNIKNSFNTIKKKNILNSVENVFGVLNNSVIPAYKDLQCDDVYKMIDKNKFIVNIASIFNVGGGKSKDIIESIYKYYVDLNNNKKKLIDVVNANIPDVLAGNAITYKQYCIVTLVGDINRSILVALSTAYLLSTDLTATSFNVKERVEREDAARFLATFIRATNGGISNYIDDIIKNTTDDIIGNNDAYEEQKATIQNKGLDKIIPRSNFMNNPIYHFRMWLADRDVNKIDRLTDEKELLEAQVTNLRLKARDVSDDSLQKQIEYYENKISSIDYKIKKLEN